MLPFYGLSGTSVLELSKDVAWAVWGQRSHRAGPPPTSPRISVQGPKLRSRMPQFGGTEKLKGGPSCKAIAAFYLDAFAAPETTRGGHLWLCIVQGAT